MKKTKLLSNIFWLIGLVIITLVIAGTAGYINIPVLTKEPYLPTTPEEIVATDRCIQLTFCIGYFFIAISIIIKICDTICRNTTEKNKNKNTNTNKLLKYLGLLCKIVIVIFTVIIIILSLFMLFLSLIDFSNIPL